MAPWLKPATINGPSVSLTAVPMPAVATASYASIPKIAAG